MCVFYYLSLNGSSDGDIFVCTLYALSSNQQVSDQFFRNHSEQNESYNVKLNKSFNGI